MSDREINKPNLSHSLKTAFVGIRQIKQPKLDLGNGVIVYKSFIIDLKKGKILKIRSSVFKKYAKLGLFISPGSLLFCYYFSRIRVNVHMPFEIVGPFE